MYWDFWLVHVTSTERQVARLREGVPGAEVGALDRSAVLSLNKNSGDHVGSVHSGRIFCGELVWGPAGGD